MRKLPKELWRLDPEITFLNHGSFGACPKAVLDHQDALRNRLESEPVRFMERELEPRWEEAREAVAHFVGANPAGLAFVANATSGVGAVLRSLSFGPGDELLTTNHEYPASRNSLAFAAHQSGASLVVADVPFPVRSEEQVVEAILRALTPHTKLALIDHVTSATALVFPIARIVAELSDRGIDTLVDGAHAPGMLEVDVESIGAAYYTANCHKWMCAPKGAAFLYVREDRRADIHPLAISLGYSGWNSPKSQYHLEFDWTGTRDPTAALCVPTALNHLDGMVDGGWTEIRRHNRQLNLEVCALLCDVLSTTPPAPASMLGSMVSFPIKARQELHDALFDGFAIQVPLQPWSHDVSMLRISSFLYNELDETRKLAAALRELGVP